MSKLYPYPAVQYIPLSVGFLFRQENVPSRPFILIGREIHTQQKMVEERYEVQLPTFKDTDRLPLVAGGFEPLEVKYRGYYVTIKATLNSVLCLISLPTSYFYKDSLVFQVKNESGDLLVAKTYKLPDHHRHRTT